MKPADSRAIAAISGGVSYFYYFSEPNLVYLDPINEETGPKSAPDPKKWQAFKLQEKVTVGHNTHIYRSSSYFHNSYFIFYSCLLRPSCFLLFETLTHYAEGKRKYVFRPYTPISNPDFKGYFDLMIKSAFCKIKSSLVEKVRYTPYMKKHIGMIAGVSGITPMLQAHEAIL
ncbi:hypothetical protein L1887_30399 [Cichorium endivia]|nr:hypothetical protein L1887_30399 [Cichorium endivia]